MTSFNEQILARHAEGKYLCVGLDPTGSYDTMVRPPGQFSMKYNFRGSKVFDYMMNVIENTHNVAAAYKINPSYYLRESDSNAIMGELISSIQYQEIPVILDGKYGDVAHTNHELSTYAFDELNVDAVTVNPYTGFANLAPFLGGSGKGVIVFCESTGKQSEIQSSRIDPDTLNGERNHRFVGSSAFPVVEFELDFDYQEKLIRSRPRTISEKLAFDVDYEIESNSQADVWLTAPGDKPSQIARLRQIAPSVPFLIPGCGAQGGDVAAAVRAAGGNCLITVSRSVTSFGADRPLPFPDDIRSGAVDYNNQITQTLNVLTKTN